ncbi:hypothetical protein B0J13DRAFT_556557 [Dactylonectria estremocensis]|uniref:PNPLA domain-containing protein n=1 Tax=Dactylonectria estremocensis TaxID=1079267 RepID=A0A9P9EPJ6_9HYPO|nr:hypothetical protein B0J13DRAFT_556557 [Dactylonectria estremocensis]
MAPEQSAMPRGLALLSLDGGGLRNPSSLSVLKNIMDRINNNRRAQGFPPCKPCDVFDMIAGINTGGLIAIMLGRLRMDVEECISAYSEIAKTGLQQKTLRSRFSMFNRPSSRFDLDKVKEAIVETIRRKNLSPQEPFNHGDGNDSCKVFVCATSSNSRNTDRLRSYTLTSHPGPPITICDAALATLATLACFDSVTIQDTQFVPCVLSANNPIGEVEQEARNVWPSAIDTQSPSISFLLSIGAGNPHLDPNDGKSIYATLVNIAKEAKQVADEFINTRGQQHNKTSFFRFNSADQQLQTTSLSGFQRKRNSWVDTTNLPPNSEKESEFQRLAQLLKDKRIIQISRTSESRPDLFHFRDDHTTEPPARFQDDVDGYADQIPGVVTRRGHSQIPCHSIPFPKNEHLPRPIAKLDALTNMLLKSSTCARASLVGVHGAGKTELALQFAYRVQEMMPHFSIFWVSASGLNTFVESYARIAAGLGILQESQGQDVKVNIQEFLSSKRAGPWLMVVDNIAYPDEFLKSPNVQGLARYLPNNSDGRILFTTSSREVSAILSGSNVVSLEMNHEEAASFLEECLCLARKHLLRDTGSVAQLIEKLVCLPPAVAQVAAYLDRNQVSMPEYLELLRGHNVFSEPQNTVANPWLVSLDRISENNAQVDDLLLFLSRIAPKIIPRSILPHAKSGSKPVYAIDVLLEYHFLAQRADDDMFHVPQLAHFSIQLWVERNLRAKESMAAAIKQLNRAMPANPRGEKQLWKEFLPHAQKILRDSDDDSEERIRLSHRVGKGLMKHEQVSEATACFNRCLNLLYAKYGKADPKVLSDEYNIARAYRKSRQSKKALELIQEVVNKSKGSKAVTKENQVLYEYELGRCYQDNKDYKKAISTLQNVVEMEGQMLPPDDISLIESQLQLAISFRKDGQSQETTIQILEGIVGRSVTALPRDDKVRVLSQYYLARAYAAEGRVGEATKIFSDISAVETRLQANGRERCLNDYAMRTLRKEIGPASGMAEQG